MEYIPSDVFTHFIFMQLSHKDQLALLSVMPNLSNKVKWDTIYESKYDELSCRLLELHDEFFTIKKKARLDAMRKFYDCIIVNETTLFDPLAFIDTYFRRNIPIVEDDVHSTLQEYIRSFDDIYDDIILLKNDIQDEQNYVECELKYNDQ